MLSAERKPYRGRADKFFMHIFLWELLLAILHICIQQRQQITHKCCTKAGVLKVASGLEIRPERLRGLWLRTSVTQMQILVAHALLSITIQSFQT